MEKAPEAKSLFWKVASWVAGGSLAALVTLWMTYSNSQDARSEKLNELMNGESTSKLLYTNDGNNIEAKKSKLDQIANAGQPQLSVPFLIRIQDLARQGKLEQQLGAYATTLHIKIGPVAPLTGFGYAAYDMPVAGATIPLWMNQAQGSLNSYLSAFDRPEPALHRLRSDCKEPGVYYFSGKDYANARLLANYLESQDPTRFNPSRFGPIDNGSGAHGEKFDPDWIAICPYTE